MTAAAQASSLYGQLLTVIETKQSFGLESGRNQTRSQAARLDKPHKVDLTATGVSKVSISRARVQK